jgi:hypothetical protein
VAQGRAGYAQPLGRPRKAPQTLFDFADSSRVQ